MQADTLFDLMREAEIPMAIYCGPAPKRTSLLCSDCSKRNKEACPFEDVHPHALACGQFINIRFDDPAISDIYSTSLEDTYETLLPSNDHVVTLRGWRIKQPPATVVLK